MKPVETLCTEILNAQLEMWLLFISKLASDLRTSTGNFNIKQQNVYFITQDTHIMVENKNTKMNKKVRIVHYPTI